MWASSWARSTSDQVAGKVPRTLSLSGSVRHNTTWGEVSRGTASPLAPATGSASTTWMGPGCW